MGQHEPVDRSADDATSRGRRAKTDYPFVDGSVTRHMKTPHAGVFLYALGGRGEPGEANFLLAQHLVSTLHRERVFTFDPDEFIDYSTNRPTVTLDRTKFVDYQPVQIAVDMLRDDEGTSVALLHGPEPDLAWEKFADHVVAIVKEMGADLSIGMRSVPMTVPHTRPVHVVAHGTSELIADQDELVDGVVQMPAAMASAIEYKLSEAGMDTIGFGAGIPFYLTQNPYPQASAELIRKISSVTGLALPVGDLEAAAAQISASIAEEVENDPRLTQMVKWMESQYDAREIGEGAEDAAPLTDVPSADEIGAAAEAFLADFTREQTQNDEADEPEDRPGPTQ